MRGDVVIVRGGNVLKFGTTTFMGISLVIGFGAAWSGAHSHRAAWAVVALAIAGVAWGVRGARIAVLITPRTIRVRNQLRTYSVSRDEAVRIVDTDNAGVVVPTAMARLARVDGDEIPLMATKPWHWGASYFTDTTRDWAVDAARQRTARIRAAIERAPTA